MSDGRCNPHQWLINIQCNSTINVRLSVVLNLHRHYLYVRQSRRKTCEELSVTTLHELTLTISAQFPQLGGTAKDPARQTEIESCLRALLACSKRLYWYALEIRLPGSTHSSSLNKVHHRTSLNSKYLSRDNQPKNLSVYCRSKPEASARVAGELPLRGLHGPADLRAFPASGTHC